MFYLDACPIRSCLKEKGIARPERIHGTLQRAPGRGLRSRSAVLARRGDVVGARAGGGYTCCRPQSCHCEPNEDPHPCSPYRGAMPASVGATHYKFFLLPVQLSD